MPAELFVDSSAWYPLARASHPDHERLAAELRARVAARQRVVTTNLVVAESHALVLSRAGSQAALRFLRELRSPPNEIVISEADLEQRAMSGWLERFADQAFSLTDAVSFEVMKARRIRNALTLDNHFVIAGFVMVPSATAR